MLYTPHDIQIGDLLQTFPHLVINRTFDKIFYISLFNGRWGIVNHLDKPPNHPNIFYTDIFRETNLSVETFRDFSIDKLTKGE